MTQVSIIIRTLNEERYLGRLLEAIELQNTSFSHETVLIDSGSTDRTLNIAKSFKCRIMHIERSEFSFGRSLNRACEAASGNYLVLISGHCIPCDEYWLEKLVLPLKDKKVHYSYGRQLGGPHTYWSEKRIFANYFPEVSAIPQDGFYCNNANSALSTDIWRHYKFDEELTGLEDMHLAKNIVSNGGSVGYVADAAVYHLHHENWSQVQRRYEREALALQQICPEVILRRRDVLSYIIRSICSDIYHHLSLDISIRCILNIIKYRFYQYKGSYKGNHSHKKLSRQLKDTYFYPTPSKGRPLTHYSL